jgi:ankyrin repeat protein
MRQTCATTALDSQAMDECLRYATTGAGRHGAEYEAGRIVSTFVRARGSVMRKRALLGLLIGSLLFSVSGCSGVIPLRMAVQLNMKPVVSVLLKAGAKVNGRDNSGWTPLMWAAMLSDPEVISVLLEAGARVDDKETKHGGTPLTMAAMFNSDPEVISALLKVGAKVDYRDDGGRTPLMYAAMLNPNPEVISVLLKAGANGKLRSNDRKTAFDYAAKNEKLKGTPQFLDLQNAQFSTSRTGDFFKLVKDGTPEQVQAAIHDGANVNDRDKNGETYGGTPLMQAAATNPNPGVIAVLLKAGAKIHERNSYGATPVMFAAANLNPEINAALLKAGARIDDRSDNGATPLLTAAATNPNPEVLTTLLEAGARIDERDKNGATPLMIAVVYNQNPEIIAALLKAGANGRLKSKEGKTAYDYAAGNERLKGTQLLQDLKDAQF